jgi:phospholipid N-methyltransferase
MVSSRAYLRVWPASVALATYLLNEIDFKNRKIENILELGCGTGFCSLALISFI